jgi:hypothetical protein
MGIFSPSGDGLGILGNPAGADKILKWIMFNIILQYSKYEAMQVRLLGVRDL